MTQNQTDDVVTPWETKCGKGGFQYARLIEKFGVEPITDELLTRFQQVTKREPHMFLRRGIFFAHRQLNEILDDYEQHKPIFLYTGRGPTSDALHLGHMIPFFFMKWLQDVFDAYLVIQIADDEKYYFKEGMSFETIYKLGFENSKDIIACGFNPEKTFIFSNRDYSTNKCVVDLVAEMWKHINVNTVQQIFGLQGNCSVGQLNWPIYQTAAAFPKFYEQIFKGQNARCFVVYAIDQDPYFRLARDVASKLQQHKPCSVMAKFLPALEGEAKMSSTGSTANSTIYVSDTPKEIYNKIKKYAFSGGRDTLEQQRELGANLEVDMSYQYLRYFMEDDAELEKIASAYSTGKILTGEIKKLLADVLIAITQKHQQARSAVTEDMVKYFYNINK